MGDYTQFLSTKGNSISPEDENYIQELLEVASSFRTFDAALDAFLVQRGYTGDLADTEAKVRFIKHKFDEAGIPIEARILKGWFSKSHTGRKTGLCDSILLCVSPDAGGNTGLFLPCVFAAESGLSHDS